MDADEDRKGAGLRFPPPLIAVVVIALAWQADGFYPWPILPAAGYYRPLGAVGVGAALLLALVAVWQLRRAGTAIEPWYPTTAVVQRGVYRFSRNPIYLSYCLATLGVGLWLDSGWIALSTLAVGALLQWLVIRREEAYLSVKFGDAYDDYCRRVRRWL